jgi:hypothetical protein
MHQTSSGWQNIYRVQDHEFHVFLSPIKHDLVLDMNCLLYDFALMVDTDSPFILVYIFYCNFLVYFVL